MPLTGKLGTPQAQPGQVQPGFYCTGNAAWTGTTDAVVTFGVPGVNIHVKPVQTLTVALSVASQLAQADPGWWAFH